MKVLHKIATIISLDHPSFAIFFFFFNSSGEISWPLRSRSRFQFLKSPSQETSNSSFNMADKKTEEPYKRPQTMTRCQQISKFLYNGDTHEVLGRTAKSWCKLILLYFHTFTLLRPPSWSDSTDSILWAHVRTLVCEKIRIKPYMLSSTVLLGDETLMRRSGSTAYINFTSIVDIIRLYILLLVFHCVLISCLFFFSSINIWISVVQITVFYIVLYAFLAGFFVALLTVFYQTLNDHEPKWTMESSLIGNSPGESIKFHNYS